MTGPPYALTEAYMERASRSAMEARTEKNYCRKMKVVVKAGPVFWLRPVSNVACEMAAYRCCRLLAVDLS